MATAEFIYLDSDRNGAGKNAVRFSPPLVLTRDQADTAVKIFDEALTEVEGRAR